MPEKNSARRKKKGFPTFTQNDVIVWKNVTHVEFNEELDERKKKKGNLSTKE